jgi:hypothetical protein
MGMDTMTIINAVKQAKQPDKLPAEMLTNNTQKTVKVRSPKPRFEVSTVIDEFQGMNENLIVNDGEKGVIGTANPYQFNLFSDLITNPSSISISEFQKMVYTQPILSAGLTILNNLIKNEFGSFQHKNKKYQEFIQIMFDNFDRPFDEILIDMQTAWWAGFSVGEKKYKSDGRYVYITDIEPRPAQSIIYRVDSQGHLKDDGIIQYYFNNLWIGYGNLLSFNSIGPNGRVTPNPYASRGDFDYPWRTVWAQPIGTVIIPKNKCVHFAYKGLDGLTSPYGRSLLRAAYDSYLVRSDMNRILHNSANYKASPIPVVIIDPNQANDPSGYDVFEETEFALQNLGVAGGGNSYLLFRGTKESVIMDKMDSTANLQDLVGVSEYFDKMMLTAILFPSELAGLSDKGSYALGKTQQDLLGRNVTSMCEMLRNCIIEQVVKPTLQLNFNEQEDFGSFEVTDNVAEDVALNLDKLNSLLNYGIKLKPGAIAAMLDISEDSIESWNNPVVDNNPDNRGINTNFMRTRGIES